MRYGRKGCFFVSGQCRSALRAHNNFRTHVFSISYLNLFTSSTHTWVGPDIITLSLGLEINGLPHMTHKSQFSLCTIQCNGAKCTRMRVMRNRDATYVLATGPPTCPPVPANPTHAHACTSAPTTTSNYALVVHSKSGSSSSATRAYSLRPHWRAARAVAQPTALAASAPRPGGSRGSGHDHLH